MFILKACDNSNVLNAVLFVKSIINIVFIIVPILLALFFSIDLFKNIFPSDAQETDKNLKLGIKRIVYSLILLFVPLLVETFMGMIDNYSKIASCYSTANEAKAKSLHDKEEADYKAKKEADDKKKKENAALVAKEQAEARNAAKNAEREAINNKNNGSDTSSNTNVDDQYHKSQCKIGEATSSDGRVAMNNFYDGNYWSYVARFKDPKKSNLAAQCINELSARSNILYDADRYTSLWDEAAKHNFDIYKIDKSKTLYTVCCPFVTVCAKYAGVQGISERAKTFACDQSLSNMVESIEETGEFTIIPWSQIESCHDLMQGDILISKWHEAMAY